MKFSLRHILIALAAAMSAGCSDDVAKEAYYTFTGDTVASYCEERPDTYSIFTDLVNDTGNRPLLSTYGHYTVFAPDNAAFESYFHSIGKSYGELTLAEKQEIVFNHIIKSSTTDYTSSKFEEGALAESTMSDNFVVISYDTDSSGAGLMIYINRDVPVLERDIEVHNGVVHRVGAVITAPKEFITDVMGDKDAVGNLSFGIFIDALKATHLADSIRKIRDEHYQCPDPSGKITVGGWTAMVPLEKKYGFTVFAESDKVMAGAGINSLDDLAQYARRFYSDEAPGDYTSRRNALNKFVSYHILDRRMSTNAMLYSGLTTSPNNSRDRQEFYETLYDYHIIKVNVGIVLNRSERNKADCITVNEDASNISAVNGYIHALNSMLVYDSDKMENDVLNCRIRFDVYSIPPEFTNNNIRWKLTSLPSDVNAYTVTHDFCSRHMAFSPETEIIMWGNEYWRVHQADELKLNGWYDLTMRLIPVPPGSYEVRVGYTPAPWRGITQFFLDGQIQGIPRDLRVEGNDPFVGWIPDTGTFQDADNDKAMRNRGYMKAPASIWSQNDNCSLRDLKDGQPLRIIIGTLNVQNYGAHYLRAKNVYSADREFNGDYIELIPTSLIDTEDIY